MCWCSRQTSRYQLAPVGAAHINGPHDRTGDEQSHTRSGARWDIRDSSYRASGHAYRTTRVSRRNSSSHPPTNPHGQPTSVSRYDPVHVVSDGATRVIRSLPLSENINRLRAFMRQMVTFHLTHCGKLSTAPSWF